MIQVPAIATKNLAFVCSLCMLQVRGAGTIIVWQGVQLLEHLSNADLGRLLSLEPIGQCMAMMAAFCGDDGWGLAEVNGAIISGLRVIKEMKSGKI